MNFISVVLQIMVLKTVLIKNATAFIVKIFIWNSITYRVLFVYASRKIFWVFLFQYRYLFANFVSQFDSIRGYLLTFFCFLYYFKDYEEEEKWPSPSPSMPSGSTNGRRMDRDEDL